MKLIVYISYIFQFTTYCNIYLGPDHFYNDSSPKFKKILVEVSYGQFY